MHIWCEMEHLIPCECYFTHVLWFPPNWGTIEELAKILENGEIAEKESFLEFQTCRKRLIGANLVIWEEVP